MLEILAKDHEMWLSMVIGMGCDISEAEDIVQDMYLKIHKYVKEPSKIMYDKDSVNRVYIYLTLRNLFFDYKKERGKYIDIEQLSKAFVYEDDFNEEENRAFERLINMINKEMSSWHNYDKILSEKYLKTDFSYRDIAKGTGISLTSIFHSMKKNKGILKHKFKEDYEDYMNEDYNLI